VMSHIMKVLVKDFLVMSFNEGSSQGLWRCPLIKVLVKDFLVMSLNEGSGQGHFGDAP